MHRCWFFPAVSSFSALWIYCTVWLLSSLKCPTANALSAGKHNERLVTESSLCARVLFIIVWLFDTMSNTPWTQWGKSQVCLAQVWRGHWQRWPQKSSAWPTHLYCWMGPRSLSMQTSSQPVSIATSSSISLTAGESENNAAKQNTMTGYWRWPYDAIISSCGHFQRELRSQHQPNIETRK